MKNKQHSAEQFIRKVLYLVTASNNPLNVVSRVQAYSNYGDIIRHTMTKCRDISNSAFAKALLLSLQQEFEKLQDDNDGTADTNSKEFAGIKVIFFKY